jgi:hypothetical protein
VKGTENVEKINYYYCGELISSEKNSPYTCNWRNVPVGSHYLYAEAVAIDGTATTSDSVAVEVKKRDQQALLPPGGRFSLFVNMGSNKGTTFNNLSFEGEQRLESSQTVSYSYTNTKASSEPLYQSERNGSTLNYPIPVTNGT